MVLAFSFVSHTAMSFVLSCQKCNFTIAFLLGVG